MSRYTLRWRPITAWPGATTRNRKPSPFTGSWTDTLGILDRELAHLHAIETSVVLQVAIREQDLRLDGQVRANARPLDHPGVILSFDSKTLGALSYPCDTFDAVSYRSGLQGWQVNVRAIALGLEALRKVTRYGIAPGNQQYTGWKALGAGIALAPAMSIDDAAAFLIQWGEWGGTTATITDMLTATADVIDLYYRSAARQLHPDAGGDAERFRKLNDARDLLKRHAS